MTPSQITKLFICAVVAVATIACGPLENEPDPQQKDNRTVHRTTNLEKGDGAKQHHSGESLPPDNEEPTPPPVNDEPAPPSIEDKPAPLPADEEPLPPSNNDCRSYLNLRFN